jgi:hypothetical protein
LIPFGIYNTDCYHHRYRQLKKSISCGSPPALDAMATPLP